MNRDNRAVAALTQGWWAPLAVLVGLFDVTFGLAIAADTNSTMPGRVIGPVLSLLAGLVIAIGLTLRASARTMDTSGATSARAGYVALLAAAVVLLVAGAGGRGVLLLGALAVVGSLGVLAAARGTTQGTAVADGLLLLGMLPALTMFWMIVPPLLAIAVIAGVLTSNRRPTVATT
jgi:hypothetical protein